MSDVAEKGWDELAALWCDQPAPDVADLAAKVGLQRRRLLLTQAGEAVATIVVALMTWVMFTLTPDPWLRGFTVVVAAYVVVQQYLMARSTRGLWKYDAFDVLEMAEHSIRHYRQRIYRLRLRLLEPVVVGAAAIPLIWHLSSGTWSGFLKTPAARAFAVLIAGVMAVNIFWALSRMPRFRRALREAQKLRDALAGDDEA